MVAEPNSPALAAGLRGGDVLLAVNGKRICQDGDAPRLIAASGIGTEITITYSRAGRIMTTKLRVVNRTDFDPGYAAEMDASQRINASWTRNDFKAVINECEKLRNPNPYFVHYACGLVDYYHRHVKQGENVFAAAESSCPMCPDVFANHALGRHTVGQQYLDLWNKADQMMKDFRSAQDQAFTGMDSNVESEMKDLAEKGQVRTALDRYVAFANDEDECRDTPPSKDLAEFVANLTLRENPSLDVSQPARRKAEMARSLKKVASNGTDLSKAYGYMNSAIWLAPWWSAAYADAADMLETLGLPTESMELANRALSLPRAKVDATELATAAASREPAEEITGNPESVLQSCIASLATAEAGSADERRLKTRCIKAAQKMSPKRPEVPAEAERHVARGQAGMEMGQSPTDFADASSEYEMAIRIAPWWPDAYRGLALAREKAANYQQAIEAYQFYLLAAPGATDAKEIQNKIYKLEFAVESEQKRAIEKSMSQRQQAARTQGLQGIWREKGNGMIWQAALQDGMFTAHKPGYSQDGWIYSGQFVIKAALKGNELIGTFTQPASTESKSACDVTQSEQPLNGTISEDAKSITIKYQAPVYTSDFVRGTLFTNARCIKIQKMRDDLKIIVIEKQ
jgi:tetratricopeptide (TPR) repeat protein